MASPDKDRSAAKKTKGDLTPGSPEGTPRRNKPATIVNADPQVPTEPQSQIIHAGPAKALGRYQILGELGRGGMGTVYLAEDTVLKRKVALKIPQFELHKAEQFQARFLREAQMAAQLSHPNICQVYDVGVIDGQYVMAMEFVEGRTLSDFTKPEKLLSERQVVTLIRKVALAVEAAHQKGLIHRDLKPGNIMLPKPDPIRKVIEPKVMDFGLAKSLQPRGTELTKSGMIVGTPCYMSKEQWSVTDKQLGPECDVYSLGVILYELLTGQLPYDVHNDEPSTAWFVKLVTQPAIRLSERKPDIDAAIEVIVMKTIEPESQDRFSSMLEFADALEAWQKGAPTTRVRPKRSFAEIYDAPNHPLPSIGNGSSQNQPPRIPPKLLLWGGLGGAATVFLGIVIVILFGGGEEPVPGSTPPGIGSVSLTDDKPKREPPLAIAPFDSAQALEHQKAWASYVDQPVEIENSVGMKLRLIPAGEFVMGSPDDEEGRDADEGPQHEVRISKPYYLGTTEVTQGQWFAVMGTRPWKDQSNVQEGDNYPATHVSWEDARSFCEKLSRTEGKAYHLPTEAEWEYACRVGKASPYSFGENASQLKTYGWYDENSGDIGEPHAHPVGTKKANDFGLYDMHGNVREWCHDWKKDYDETSAVDPQGPSSGSSPVFRGGSWFGSATQCRSAYRYASHPSSQVHYLGFRLALSPSGKMKYSAPNNTGTESSRSLNASTAEVRSENRTTPPPAVVPFDTDQAEEHQKAWAEYIGEPVEIENSLGMKLRLIPAGEFVMGSPEDEEGRFEDEGPQHEVRISKPYYLGATEVTQGQWFAVMGTRPWLGQSNVEDGENNPVTHVPWDDATEFCRKLSQEESTVYRLPTEAEWEYACRAGMTELYSFGSDASQLGEFGWYSGNTTEIEEEYAHEVGMKGPNNFGLYDMHGNVWEWCSDRKGDYDSTAAIDPRGSESGTCRVFRGGSWREGNTSCRSANRSHDGYGQPSDGITFRGIRVVRSPSGDPGHSNIDSGSHKVGLVDVPPTEHSSNASETPQLAIAPFGSIQAQEHQERWAAFVGQPVEIENSVGMKLRLIPAGEFVMGSPDDEEGRDADEVQHEVRISKPYYMGTTEVTQGQWFAVMGTRPRKKQSNSNNEGDNYPTTYVTWEDATEFCEQLSQTEGKTYRLPTEAEWEYACRAGKSTPYSFGTDTRQLQDYGWFNNNASLGGAPYAHEVGTKMANDFGLYDMHGNVWEWCKDWHAEYEMTAAVDPTGASFGSGRVNRGGGWGYTARACRSAIRDGYDPALRGIYLGFRLVLSPSVK